MIAALATLAVLAPPGQPDDPNNCILDGNIWTDWLQPAGCSNTSIAGEFVKNTIFEPYVNDIRNGAADSIKTLTTFWVSVPDPDVGNADTGVASDVVGFLQSGLAPLVGFLMVLTVVFAGIKIMWDANRAGEAFREAVGMLIRYILVSAMAVPVIATGMIIARAVGEWVLQQSTQGTNFTDNLFALFNNDAGFTSALFLMVLLLIGALVSAIQVGVMIARGGALLVLTGTILISVAVSGSPEGKQMFKTHVGWIIAFIAYAPAASIVYAAGFRLMGADTAAAGSGVMQCIYGIVIMILAIFTLPALLRLVAAFTTPVASGKGAGSAVAGAAVTAATMGMVRAA